MNDVDQMMELEDSLYIETGQGPWESRDGRLACGAKG